MPERRMVLVYWYGSTAGLAKFKADQFQEGDITGSWFLSYFVPGTS